MSKECKDFEIEIAAAGAGELPARVAGHVDACAGCARLREQAQALAGTGRPAPDGPGARAIARRAIAQAGRRGPLVWALPLLSASASAAALILYFGIFHGTGAGTGAGPDGLTAEATSRQAVPAAAVVTLPDSLRAVSELLIEEREEENEK